MNESLLKKKKQRDLGEKWNNLSFSYHFLYFLTHIIRSGFEDSLSHSERFDRIKEETKI